MIICHRAGPFFPQTLIKPLLFFPGIRSWDTNLMDCNIDQELKLFVSRHSARFSADAKGKSQQRAEYRESCRTHFLRPLFLAYTRMHKHRHRCTLESGSGALCTCLSVACSAAVSLLHHPFHGTEQTLDLNILLCTAQASVCSYFIYLFFFFALNCMTAWSSSHAAAVRASSATAVSLL